MPRYNHAFDIAFEVASDHENSTDIPPDALLDALEARVRALRHSADPHEILEACGAAFDSYEMED